MLFNVLLPLFQTRQDLNLKEDVEGLFKGASEMQDSPDDDWSLSKMFDHSWRIVAKMERSKQDIKFCVVACVLTYFALFGAILFGLTRFSLADSDLLLFSCVFGSPLAFMAFYDFITVTRISQEVREYLVHMALKKFINGFEHGFRAQRHQLGIKEYPEWFGQYESGGVFKVYTWVKDLAMGATVLATAGGWKHGFGVARILSMTDQVGSSLCSNFYSISNAARQRGFVDVPRRGLGFFKPKMSAKQVVDTYVLSNIGAIASTAFGLASMGILAYRHLRSRPVEVQMSKPWKQSANHGVPEAKGKNSQRRNLLKTGTTKVGRRFWAYEDDEGAEVFVFESDEGDIIAGPMKGAGRWLYDRFDDEFEYSNWDDGTYESSGLPAKFFGKCPKIFMSRRNGMGYPLKKTVVPPSPKKKKPEAKDGKQESSLGGCGVATSKCSILKVRLRTDHSVWMNAPVVGGKVLAYKHLSGRKPFEADNFEFVHGDKVLPMLGEGQRHMESNVHDDILYFPAPQGVKSTNIPYNPLERGSVGKGVLIGFHALKDGAVTVCGGDIMPREGKLVGRHTCSTEPGYCGSLVVDLSGSHPVLVGFHSHGDDGTETNGFYKVNAELAEELRSLHFSKN